MTTFKIKITKKKLPSVLYIRVLSDVEFTLEYNLTDNRYRLVNGVTIQYSPDEVMKNLNHRYWTLIKYEE